MAECIAAPLGFAYLFEKFPSFSQTFCAREVRTMRQQGWDFPVFSIRIPANEPAQDCLCELEAVHYLPDKFDAILASDTSYRRAARRGLDDLRARWGGEEQKRRIYEALWLGPVLQKAKIRHVHTHFAGTGARTAFWLKRLFDVNYSITAHANDIFCDEPPERLAQIFEAAAVVVTVSDFSLRFLRAHYPAQQGKFFRVYNGIAVENFGVSAFPGGSPLIVSVGRYIDKKGFDVLIDACSRLTGDFTCQIIGSGPLEQDLKTRVEQRGLVGRVSITGPKTESEIKEIFTRARMFVLACQTGNDGAMDNLPTVIMEAMAAGLPVVSTNLAGVPEMVAPEKSGFLVPEKDTAGLAQAMQRLQEDPDLARAQGAAGRELALELFDVQRTTASLREILTAHGAVRKN